MNQEDYGKAFKRRIDLPIACLLALGYLSSMLWSQDPGYARDETYYFNAGKRYISWLRNLVGEVRDNARRPAAQRKPLRSLSRKEIERYWAGYGNNHEHPPLAKVLMGGSWWLFTQQWRTPPPKHAKQTWWQATINRLLDRLRMPADRAQRFPGMCWAALMILLVYLWGTQAFNRRVGMFAAFALMLMPRFFFHAHLAAFDVPISAMWLLVTYAFWRGMNSSWWGLLCGIFFGLALATKHNSWILPGVLGIYWLSQTWNKYRVKVHHDGTYQVRFPPMHGALYSGLLFGPLLMIGLWPLLWPTDPFHIQGWKVTWQHLSFYVSFHLKHNHYDAYYFGTLFLKPPFPWHFPLIMTLVTVPIATISLSLGGFWFLLRQQRIATHLLWWGFWTVRNPLWRWLLSPLLSMALSIVLLLPALLLGVIWLAFKLLEWISLLVPGSLGASVRRGWQWLAGSSQSLSQDIREWNPWSDKERQPREYSPRPVGPADKTGFLWLLNAAIPIAVIAMPSTPIFGGTKHWMPAWPFLALMAGLGFERACQVLQQRRPALSRQRLLLGSTLFALLLLTPALFGLIRSHPHGLAYYNTLIGGPRGSANWGMQRSFWAPDTKAALPWLNQHAKPARPGRRIEVDFHDSNASSYYHRNHWLKQHIVEPWRLGARSRPYRPGDYLVFVHQKWLHTQLYNALAVMRARTPVHGVYLDEAPLITIWHKNSHHIPTWW